jgi:hypothetical protein
MTTDVIRAEQAVLGVGHAGLFVMPQFPNFARRRW